MEARSEPGLFEDVWFQILGLLVLVSGMLTAHMYWGRLSAWGQGGAQTPAGPPAAAPPVPGAQPPAAQAPSSEPGAAQAPVSRPRVPGRWVVDAKLGAGADCATLREALAEGSEGDVIMVRPGTYDEAVAVARSVAITGAGVSPDQVTLTHSGAQTILVAGGRVALENLSMTNTGMRSSSVLSASKSRLALKNVRMRTAGVGIRVSDADVDIADSELDGRIALSVAGKSRVNVSYATITGEEAGVSAAGGGVDLKVESSRIQDGRGIGLDASKFARVRMTDVTLSGHSGVAIQARSGAEVQLSRAKIMDNRDCGIRVDAGFVILEAAQLARNRCGVGFVGLGTLEARNSQFSDHALGPVAVKPGLKNVVLKGGGNVGLKIPGESRSGDSGAE